MGASSPRGTSGHEGGPFPVVVSTRELNEYTYGISILSFTRAGAIAVRACRTCRIHRDLGQRSAWSVHYGPR